MRALRQMRLRVLEEQLALVLLQFFERVHAAGQCRRYLVLSVAALCSLSLGHGLVRADVTRGEQLFLAWALGAAVGGVLGHAHG